MASKTPATTTIKAVKKTVHALVSETEPNKRRPKVLKLILNNKPEAYVAFMTNADGNIEATISCKSPKDEWNHKRGHAIAVKRFATPSNRLLLTPKTPLLTFEDTRRAVLDGIAHSTKQVGSNARKAAREMVHELQGDSVRKALKTFLKGSSGKMDRKLLLVKQIFDQETVAVDSGRSAALPS